MSAEDVQRQRFRSSHAFQLGRQCVKACYYRARVYMIMEYLYIRICSYIYLLPYTVGRNKIEGPTYHRHT